MNADRRVRRLAGKRVVSEYLGLSLAMLYRLQRDPDSNFPAGFKPFGNPADPRIRQRGKLIFDLDEIDRWIEFRKSLCEAARGAE